MAPDRTANIATRVHVFTPFTISHQLSSTRRRLHPEHAQVGDDVAVVQAGVPHVPEQGADQASVAAIYRIALLQRQLELWNNVGFVSASFLDRIRPLDLLTCRP